MARKVGEVFIDLFLRRDRFDRDVDQSARKAEDAGRKIEGSANRSARAYAGLNVQVGALAQRLAGLGALSAVGGAAFSELSNAVARADARRNAPGQQAINAAGGDDAQFAAYLATLTPTQQAQAQRSRAVAKQFQTNTAAFTQAVQGKTGGFLGSFGGLRNLLINVNERFQEPGESVFRPGLGAGLSLEQSFPGIINDQNIVRGETAPFVAQQNANTRAQIQAIGDAANPAIAAGAQLDILQRMLESLQRLEAQGSAPQPGGATP